MMKECLLTPQNDAIPIQSIAPFITKSEPVGTPNDVRGSIINQRLVQRY